jgi:hypothetical protein
MGWVGWARENMGDARKPVETRDPTGSLRVALAFLVA